ncbi:MAG: A/G-specific adenine glycosylase [Clostridia bacterium]|nr:A/G-specific adenine glycosylase [Clostridia bacterium]
MAELKDLPGLLLPWYQQNKRDLPWRKDKDPYRVWLSEIMLQQTRVEAVKGYYARFLQALPTVEALANCDEELLLKLWEGLGYYNRARNLQKAAKIVAETGFPDTYEGLLNLPGVGEYTAGAVASICFDRPVAAVDGNVLRVLSRYLADGRPIDDPKVKKDVKAALEAVYPAETPGAFTQALMELGATICVPNGPPKCEICPLKGQCRAFLEEKTALFPVKTEKKARKIACRAVFLLRCGDKLAIEKRPARGLLAGLWQLPNIEGPLSPEQAVKQAADWGCEPHDLLSVRQKKHIFTHITWEMEGFELRCGREDPRFVWATPGQLEQDYALPTAFRQFLEE